MITFGNNSNDTKDQVITEGILTDTVKGLSGVDVDEIRKEWEAIDAAGGDDNTGYNGVLKKAGSIQKHGVGGVDKHLTDTANKLKKHEYSGKSIIARARNSVLQFPIYTTQTIRVNEAQIISKLFERVYTTLVQTVLSQNQIIDEEDANNLVFLKQFHSNLKESGELFVNKYYTPIDDLDAMMSESVFYTEKINDDITVKFRWVPATTNQDLIAECARLTNEPLTGLHYLKEADDTVKRTTQKTSEVSQETKQRSYLSEDDLKEMAIDRAKLNEREKSVLDMSDRDIRAEASSTYPGDDNDDDIQEKRNKHVFKRMAEKRDARKKMEEALDDLKEDIKNKKVKGYGFDGHRYFKDSNTVTKSTNKTTETRDEQKRAPDRIRAVDAPKLLRDADIKKINGMLPYTIECSFIIRSRNGGLDREVHYIIGIKSVMHLIRVQDLAEDLREIITGNIKSLQKVRYKTGEISFTDYLFNIKGIKKDASKHINYNKRWLNTLKRLGEYEKMKNSFLKGPISAVTGGSTPVPNGTIILSQTDVTTLTNETGIDLSSVANAKRLAKALFLIAVAIVDSSAGTMRVLFPDSDTDWDVQSLSSIDAEISKTDNSQILRELQRMANR